MCRVARSRVPLLAALCAVLTLPAGATAAGNRMPALEAALSAGGFYAGSDAAAARAIPPPRTRTVLGQRVLRLGRHGFDVAELELALAWQGFPSGSIDGRFGPELRSALIRFQRAVELPPDGVAGQSTFASLRRRPPVSPIPLGWPLLTQLGDGFGPRADRFHAGIDLPAPFGTGVIAAAPGRVAWAAPRDGWGNLVTIANGHGVRTMYAHLSVIDVKVGQWVAGGTLLGRVGATGDATGPHLHFEVRVGGAAIDPLRALVTLPAGA